MHTALLHLAAALDVLVVRVVLGYHRGVPAWVHVPPGAWAGVPDHKMYTAPLWWALSCYAELEC